MADIGKTRDTNGTPGFSPDRALALDCELGEREGLRQCLLQAQQLYPHVGIEMREVAGGMVAFAGVGSPLSEATAVGIEAFVTPADVDFITMFYRERGCVPRVTLGPLSDPHLGSHLARAGYVPVDFRNMLVAEVAHLQGERDPRILEANDPEAWGEASARAFADGDEPSEGMRMTGVFMAASGATALYASEAGEIVATGCLAVERSGIAALFAASTLPHARRKGWQRALIRDRIARAKEAGMRYARVEATPLGESERNFRKLGFVPLYARVLFEWRP